MLSNRQTKNVGKKLLTDKGMMLNALTKTFTLCEMVERGSILSE